jgi:hypothetical protein
MPTSVRLDPKTESLVRRLARRRGQTKSEVIREALVAFARSEEAAKPQKTAYEALEHLIGCVKGGPTDLSERTGEKFRELLLERKRRWSS